MLRDAQGWMERPGKKGWGFLGWLESAWNSSSSSSLPVLGQPKHRARAEFPNPGASGALWGRASFAPAPSTPHSRLFLGMGRRAGILSPLPTRSRSGGSSPRIHPGRVSRDPRVAARNSFPLRSLPTPELFPEPRASPGLPVTPSRPSGRGSGVRGLPELPEEPRGWAGAGFGGS